MITPVVNPCPRCGKARIDAKTWTEKVGKSTLTMTQTICPDPACQKIVEAENQKMTDKHEAFRQKDIERRLARERAKDEQKTTSKKENARQYPA